MSIFPQNKIKWHEPRKFVKIRQLQRAVHRQWWFGLLTLVSSAGAILLIWYLATLNPKKDPPPFNMVLPASLLFGVFMAYGVPWMIHLCPSEVRMTQKYLQMVRGSTHRIVLWKEVRAHRFDRLEDIEVLQLALNNGSALAIGIAKSVKSEEVSRFLEDVGVPRNDDA